MTDRSRFEDAFAGFRSLPYPPYPALEALRDWSSDLLTLDGHVAGYASRVHRGSMQAWEVPHLVGLVAEVDALRAALDTIDHVSGEDRTMIAAFRDYISAMQAMMHELDRLAGARGCGLPAWAAGRPAGVSARSADSAAPSAGSGQHAEPCR